MTADASSPARRTVGMGRLLAGVLLALLAVEVLLRLIEATPLWRVLPVVEPILGHPDRDVGYDFTPGASGIWPRENRAVVRINALGLRDVERSRAKPAGYVRIGLLGDSMVEATQVDQSATFGALAERLLWAGGRKVQLINLAMAGPSPIRQLLRLEKHGYSLGLDWVVANSAGGSFFSGLLLDDSENPAYVESSDGRLVRGHGFRSRLSQRFADHPVGRAFVALYQGSPLFRMLYLHMKKPWPAFLGLPTADSGPTTLAAGNADACAAATALLRPHIELWRDHRPARAWASTRQFLDDFAAGTSAHGVRVLYAIRDIPLPPAGCETAGRQRADLMSALAPEFTRRGMRFVDWSAAVAETLGARDTSRLQGFGVNRGGGHLNYDGHRAWAATLVRVLDGELSSAPRGQK
jgi:hypothetical protein